MLKNRIATTFINKVRAYINIIGNEEVDKLAKEGNKIELANDVSIQPHENAHSTPLWWCNDNDHPFKGPIRHLKSYLKKVKKDNNNEFAKTFDNINKMILILITKSPTTFGHSHDHKRTNNTTLKI